MIIAFPKVKQVIKLRGKSCLAGAVLTHLPLTAVTQVRYPASACEMVI